MSVPVGWSPWAKNFAVSLTQEEMVMLALGHMDKMTRLQKEDGVKMNFQVIIQGDAAENCARKVMGFLYPENNNDKVTKVKKDLATAEPEEGEGSMVLTNNEVRVLLAAGGDNIRSVEAATNTSIRFKGLRGAQQRSAIITGSGEAREKVKDIIRRMLEEERVTVTNDDIRRLLQDGGHAVKKIERESETCVQFGGRKGDRARSANIFGTEDARMKAREMMRRILEEEKEKMTMTDAEVKVLLCGKDGKTEGHKVKEIERKTGTSIQFGGKRGDLARWANIFGTEKARREAKFMIRKVVGEKREGRSRRSRSRSRERRSRSSEQGGRKRQRSGPRGRGLSVKQEKIETESVAVKKEVVTEMETVLSLIYPGKREIVDQ